MASLAAWVVGLVVAVIVIVLVVVFGGVAVLQGLLDGETWAANILGFVLIIIVIVVFILGAISALLARLRQ